MSLLPIDYSDVVVIPDITKKADPSTKTEFQELISDCDISSDELDKELENADYPILKKSKIRTGLADRVVDGTIALIEGIF